MVDVAGLQELLDSIIKLCSPRQLAMLETTSKFFSEQVNVEAICETRLKDISRAKALVPVRKCVHRSQLAKCLLVDCGWLLKGHRPSSALTDSVDKHATQLLKRRWDVCVGGSALLGCACMALHCGGILLLPPPAGLMKDGARCCTSSMHNPRLLPRCVWLPSEKRHTRHKQHSSAAGSCHLSLAACHGDKVCCVLPTSCCRPPHWHLVPITRQPYWWRLMTSGTIRTLCTLGAGVGRRVPMDSQSTRGR